jgi:hypothetical protein
MHLAYVDDSGDRDSFVLGAILVPSAQWLDVHDRLVAFRRTMSQELQFRVRWELKATELVAGGGKWRTLRTPLRTRYGLYKAALRVLAELAPSVRTLGVVVPNRADARLWNGPREDGWDRLMDRLERFSANMGSTCLLVPDEGSPGQLRTWARRKRRVGHVPAAFGGPALPRPFRQLVDDPVFRASSEGYISQWADLVAYAAFRQIKPRPEVPEKLWDELAGARLSEANDLERARRGSTEPPGLIVWPSRMRPGVPL